MSRLETVLPDSERADAGSASADRDQPTEPRHRQLVLIAEDEPHDWQIYGKLLWYNGFDVVHAVDGEAGVRLAQEHLPDLVIADLMLPGMSGLDMCRALSQDPETGQIPMIALSARKEREYGGVARQAGCTRYLEKPISPLKVLHTVESLIGKAPPQGPAARRPADWPA